MKCDECGVESDDVLVVSEYWSCGGKNCFHFEWQKDGPGSFCSACEESEFYNCEHCGAFISYNCYFGMEEYDDNGEYLGHMCPECNEFLEE